MASLQLLISSLRRAEQELERQLMRVRNAISSLGSGGTTGRRGRSGSKGAQENPKGSGRKRRKISAQARAAMSAAQKKRWAKQKAGEKK
ncbi:MAG: hypothetical protein ACRD3J_13335 [Thermoanaerobaculia bacterium]